MGHLDGLALVGEGGVAGDHEKPADLRQGRDQVFGDAVGEVFLLIVPGHVVEGQDRDRGLVGERQGLARRFGRSGTGDRRPDLIDPNRLGDILERPFAQVLKVRLDLAAHLAVSVIGEADPAWLCQTLQA